MEMEADIPPLQDFSQKPVLVGGDAVALYPSLDLIGTTEMVARVIMDSDVKFENIDYGYLLVYLLLILGEEGLRDSGLKEYIPRRTNWKDSKACSLAAQLNRDMKNWEVNTENMSWQEKRLLVKSCISWS